MSQTDLWVPFYDRIPDYFSTYFWFMYGPTYSRRHLLWAVPMAAPLSSSDAIHSERGLAQVFFCRHVVSPLAGLHLHMFYLALFGTAPPKSDFVFPTILLPNKIRLPMYSRSSIEHG